VRRINLCLILFLFVAISSYAQNITLTGKVFVTADAEGIHVINMTSKRATTTDALGTFSIQVTENDTIVFSGVQYKLHSILVDREMIDAKLVNVFLLENINQLDEVLVGKVLTGDLLSDIENSDAEPKINFYDVGIPGYEGKPKTQSERRLVEADHGKFIYVGLGFAVNLNKILNRISGRTKELKRRVELEARDELMFKVSAKFSEVLFAENPLEQTLHYEYFYFCSEDLEFTAKCSGLNDLVTLTFLQQKLKQYKANLKD